MTQCTFFDEGGEITSVSDLSDETFSFYASHPEANRILVDVQGDRKTQYVHNNELFNYTSDELDAKNNLAPGWIWKMPERIAVDKRALEVERARRMDLVNAERDKRIESFDRFTYDGHLVDGDAAAKANIDAAARGARLDLPLPDGFSWRLFDNTDLPMNNLQILEMEEAFLTASNLHRYIQHGAARIMKTEIQNAATIPQLDSITWDSILSTFS